MWKYYFALVAALWLFFNTFFRSPWQVWRRGVPVAAAPPLFCGDYIAESWRMRKPAKAAQFDKIETLQDRF